MLASAGTGLLLSVIGPTVPALAGHVGVRESDLGVVFTANFLAASVTTALAGRLFDRFGGRVMIPCGLVAMALGLLGEAVAGTLLPLTLAAAFAGLGTGIINVCIGAAAALLYPERRDATLNLLNASFGIGAFAAPLLAGLSLTRLGGYAPLYVLIALILVAPVAPLLLGLPPTRPPAGKDSSLRALLLERRLWAPVAVGFLYLGAEIGFGGWIVSIASRATGLAPADAAPIASVFWLFLALGGVPTALLLRRGLAPARIITLGAAGAIVGSVVLLLAASAIPVTVACAALVGLGFAPILPLTQAAAVHVATGRGVGTEGGAIALVMVAAQIGAASLPPIQGQLLRLGPAPAVALTLTCSVAMVLIGRSRVS